MGTEAARPLQLARGRKGSLAALLVIAGLATLFVSSRAESWAATAPRPTAIVFELDTTVSVPERVRASAKAAIAQRVMRRSIRPHGAISVYARQINHSSGTDSSARFHDVIPAVGAMPEDCTFDPSCIGAWAKAHNDAVRKARQIKRKFANWSYKVSSNGTTIRGAIAAGAEILSSEPGDRWLVLTTDLRPANAGPPVPQLRLDGVRVDVILACEDAIATCQARKDTWRAELESHGALSVNFFPFQQASKVLTR